MGPRRDTGRRPSANSRHPARTRRRGPGKSPDSGAGRERSTRPRRWPPAAPRRPRDEKRPEARLRVDWLKRVRRRSGAAGRSRGHPVPPTRWRPGTRCRRTRLSWIAFRQEPGEGTGSPSNRAGLGHRAGARSDQYAPVGEGSETGGQAGPGGREGPDLGDRLAVDGNRDPLSCPYLADNGGQPGLGLVEGVALGHDRR